MNKAPVNPPGDDDVQHLQHIGASVSEWVGSRSGVRPRPTLLEIKRGVRSSVLGTKGLHVPIIPFRTRQLDVAREKVKRLVAAYNLSDVFLFDDGSRIVAVCLKPVGLRRFRKISPGKDLWKYRNRVLWLDNLVLVDVIKGKPTHHVSRGHARLLGLEGNVGSGEVKYMGGVLRG